MKNLGDRLREADPFTAEAPLRADDVARMRRVVVAAGAGAPSLPPQAMSPRWVMVAAAVALVGTVGAMRWLQPGTDLAPATDVAADTSAVRQMQFVTPGGTRVIWTFNPEF